MAGLSTHAENKFLNQIGTDSEPGAYASTFLALFTDDPTDDATGTEVSGGSYARLEINQDGATQPYWNAPANDANDGKRFISNNGAATFVTPTASWGVVSHVAVFDALTGGNMVASGALDNSKVVDGSNPASFADAELKIKLE